MRFYLVYFKKFSKLSYLTGEIPGTKARTNKLDQHLAPGQNRTKAALVGGEHSYHCAILSPL